MQTQAIEQQQMEATLKKHRQFLFDLVIQNKTDNVNRLKQYIASKANTELDISSPINPLGMNVLHVAVTAKREDIVKWLIEDVKLDINVADNIKRTPLHYAAAHGLLEISEYLITHGANINSQNDGGDTPLMKASNFCHLHVIYLLLCRQETNDTLVNCLNETYLQILRSNKTQLQQRFLDNFNKQCPRLPQLQVSQIQHQQQQQNQQQQQLSQQHVQINNIEQESERDYRLQNIYQKQLQYNNENNNNNNQKQ